MLSKKCSILPRIFQIDPQVVTHISPIHTISIHHPETLWKEFDVRHQQSRFVNLGVVCGPHVYFTSDLIFRVCFVDDPRGSTFYIFLKRKLVGEEGRCR